MKHRFAGKQAEQLVVDGAIEHDATNAATNTDDDLSHGLDVRVLDGDVPSSGL